MNIRRFRLRNPARCPVLVEPPPSIEPIRIGFTVNEDFMAAIGRADHAALMALALPPHLVDQMVGHAHKAAQMGITLGEMDSALAILRGAHPFIVDLREAIHAVAHLGEPKCHGEF